jgi:hypothetical protein
LAVWQSMLERAYALAKGNGRSMCGATLMDAHCLNFSEPSD